MGKVEEPRSCGFFFWQLGKSMVWLVGGEGPLGVRYAPKPSERYLGDPAESLL